MPAVMSCRNNESQEDHFDLLHQRSFHSKETERFNIYLYANLFGDITPMFHKTKLVAAGISVVVIFEYIPNFAGFRKRNQIK